MTDTPPPQTPYDLAVQILTGLLADSHDPAAAAAIVAAHEARMLAARVDGLTAALIAVARELAFAARRSAPTEHEFNYCDKPHPHGGSVCIRPGGHRETFPDSLHVDESGRTWADPKTDTIDATFTTNDDDPDIESPPYKRCEHRQADHTQNQFQCDLVDGHHGWHLNGIFEWDENGEAVQQEPRRPFKQCPSVESATGLRCTQPYWHDQSIDPHGVDSRTWTNDEQL